MSGLKITLSDVTSFLSHNLPGLKKKLYLGLRQSHEFSGNKQMQMVFTAQEFLEVAIESNLSWIFNYNDYWKHLYMHCKEKLFFSLNFRHDKHVFWLSEHSVEDMFIKLKI